MWTCNLSVFVTKQSAMPLGIAVLSCTFVADVRFTEWTFEGNLPPKNTTTFSTNRTGHFDPLGIDLDFPVDGSGPREFDEQRISRMPL